jgi:aerobic carbon-monoxide dehydrogenase large subunit
VQGNSVMFFSMPDHGGTHIDAPRHFGKDATPIDEYPLEYCIVPGICIDLRHIPARAEITPEDLEAAVEKCGHPVPNKGTVLLCTGHHARTFPTAAYSTDNSGVNVAATEWLAKQGVVHFGIDSMRPGPEGKVNSLVHKACLDLDITHIESLCNLESLIGEGPFEFIGLPLKMKWKGGTGSPIRAVAVFATHRMGAGIAQALGIDPSNVRVVSRNCGGSFGMRNNPYPEEVLTAWVARRTGRPVRWTATRTESFMSDAHAREQVVAASLALDEEGHFLAMRVTNMPSVGAYFGAISTQSLLSNIGGVAGVYRTPAIHLTVKAYHTNTQSISPYRGAGRPEMTYVMERMADLAAIELGIDQVDIRQRNMITPDQMPFKTGLVFTYDSGDFPAVMDEALEAADWAGFPARREEAKGRGRLRGIGVSYPIEIAGGPPGTPMPEYADLRITRGGKYEMRLGSGDSGQGHLTTFKQILGDRFNVEPEDITFIAGDTGVVPKGTGTFGSRTVGAAGNALAVVGDMILDEARQDAAEALEVAAGDLVFEAGNFTVAGTDRRISLTDLAAKRDDGYGADWMGAADDATFPNGCHVCEVEIDPETGATEVVRYTVVDDVGVVINPLLVKGQIHGGVVQGLGQVFGEHIVYDENGQLLTASFMDYQMPRADTLPSFVVESHPVPTKMNRVGAKGAGEAGTVGALAAGINAVSDALAPLGIRHLDMPATPYRVWQAIRAAGR